MWKLEALKLSEENMHTLASVVLKVKLTKGRNP